MNVTSIKRAMTVARYEIRYPQARSLLIVWALMTIFLAWAMSIGAVQISSGSSGVGGIKAHVTSEFAQALQSAIVAIMIDGFFFAVLAGMTVPRDYEARVLDIQRASGLSPRSYVSGKFLAAGFWLFMMLFLQVLARIFFNHVLPNASMDESRGPLIVLNYIRPMIFMVAPGLIFNGAMAFFLGARTKNAVIVFLSPVALIMAYSFLFSETLLNRVPPNIREVIRLGDPSGTEWLSQTYLRDDRGASFYNTTPIDYEMPFLVSRAALLLLSAGLVMASASRSMVESPALSRFRLFGKRRNRAIAVGTDEPVEVPKKLSASISLADLQMIVRRPTWLGNVYSVARLELKNLMRGPGLWLFGIIIAFVATINAVMQPGPLDTTILVTSGNFAARSFPFVTFCTCLLALFFGTDAMERERSARVESFLFGSPIRLSAWLVGKSIACATAGFAVVASTFLGMCIAMVWQRQVWPQAWPLICIWVLLLFPTFLFWSAFVAFARSFTPNRSAALSVGFGFMALTFWVNLKGYTNWANNWSLIGQTVVWSDISQFEMQRTAIVWNRVGTLCAAVFLMTFASVRLNRLEVDTLQARSRRNFRSVVIRYAPAIVAALPICFVSGWLYLELRKGPGGAVVRKLDKDYWKRNVSTFFDAKIPTIDSLDLNLVLQPEQSSFHLQGKYTVRNHRDKSISEFPVTIGRHLKNVTWIWNEKGYKPEDRAGLLVFKKPDGSELKPGESFQLAFEYDGTYPGGMSKNGVRSMEFILPSGVVLTSFSNSFLPAFGFNRGQGLDADMTPDGRDYAAEYYKEKVDAAYGSGTKMKTRIAVTVPPDFQANSVGVLKQVVKELDGTRKYIWVSDHPVSIFNVVAGKWTVAKGEGVSIYHDPRHGLNVPDMLKALEAARKWYGEWFGAFPWQELKLSEFPGMADYAQGFPTNITFSESIGFLTLNKPDSNVAFYVTAHEAAHQWWGNLLVPGDGPGGNILSESLANYSAILLMDKIHGENARQGLTKQMEFDYVRNRQGDDERPLVKIDGRRATDQSVTYSRGGWVFWMLSNLMGRENLNKGLAELIKKFPAGSDDSPLVEDLIDIVRVHAPDKPAFDAFVNQWVKGSVMPDLQWEDVVLTKTSESGYRVSGKIKNAGSGAVSVAIASATGERFPDEKKSDNTSKYQDVRKSVKVEPGKSAEFAIETEFKPEMVVFDPDFQLLLRGRDRAEKKLALQP